MIDEQEISPEEKRTQEEEEDDDKDSGEIEAGAE